ncbi:MAG: PHP domain-containing protein [Firmicutes bacterium]|nr:PHP domain-containing protein [Bacillota bacterium]
MPKADLHLHSNRSDGVLSPYEVVTQAPKRKPAAIALPDHDTVEGIPEALRAGEELGVRVVPGIEINTSSDNGELHILGYYIDHTDVGLINSLKELKGARMHRILAIIEKLNGLGLDITKEQVLSRAGKADTMGRPHVARVLIDKGFVSSIKEAFERYIGHGRPAYVERCKLMPREAIELIKGCGGVPVLAHPGILSSVSFIDLCIAKGIQGIEAFHSRHDENQATAFTELARRHNLIVTGGSDCHGVSKHDGDLLIGRFTVDIRAVDRLKETADRNKQELKREKHFRRGKNDGYNHKKS